MGVRVRLAAVAALVAVVPLVFSAPPAAAATSPVVVRNFAFAATSDCNGPGGPVSTIQAGDTVQWRICEGGHTVTADDGRFDSGNTALTAGQTYSVPFPTPGQFNYYCRIHGSKGGVGMSGTVIVLGAPVVTIPPTAPPTTRAAPTTSRPPTTTTSRPPTTTTSRPPTTLASTTTTAIIAPAVPTTEEDEDLGGGAVAATTTTTDRSERLEEAGADDASDGGTSGWVVAALLAGILAVIGTAVWLWRRTSTPIE